MNNKNKWDKECTRMNVRMNNKNEWDKECKNECQDDYLCVWESSLV